MTGYAFGVDLGTTFTAASVHQGQRPEAITLGAKSLGIPSIVYVLADGEYRIGEEALAPAMEDPSRLVYEFKRHIGSDTDLLLPDSSHPATHFSTLLLRWVLERVVQRMHDEAPAVVAVSHPAHWNAHLVARHREVLHDAGVGDALIVTEPEAAAIFYATQAPVAIDDVVAVYDLGGGTFDTAVVRREADGFVILGTPGGIGHLGGGDFDKVVYAILNDHLDGAIDDVDPDDAEVLTDLHLLAEECTRAKEQLSANTHVTVPVRVGRIKESIRITRAEFERALRPRIAETIVTLEEALRSAEVHPSDLSRVLLVGGSSRIPLVRAMVEEAMAVPVTEDNDPVMAVAIGAAMFAHLQGPATSAAPQGEGSPDAIGEPEQEPEPERGKDEAEADGATIERPKSDVPVRIRGGMTPLDPPAPPTERAPTLRVEGSDGLAHVLAEGGVLRTGRSPDNDVVLAHELVSRYQGAFHYDEQEGWKFTDPGSRNGTYLDGVLLPKPRRMTRGPLRSAVLPPRGVLRVGMAGPELRFEVDPAQSPPGSALRLRCQARTLIPHGSKRFVVGRAASADLVVEDPSRRVSSVHLELRPSGTGWVLLDVSANGTFVDGSPIGVDPLPATTGLELHLGTPEGPLLVLEDPSGEDHGGEPVEGTITVGRPERPRTNAPAEPGAGEGREVGRSRLWWRRSR